MYVCILYMYIYVYIDTHRVCSEGVTADSVGWPFESKVLGEGEMPNRRLASQVRVPQERLSAKKYRVWLGLEISGLRC